MSELCLIHGIPLKYDMRSGLELCSECEKDTPQPEVLTRMNNEQLADMYKAQSGKQAHSSDCATSVAPAEVPGPCDCDVTQPAPDAEVFMTEEECWDFIKGTQPTPLTDEQLFERAQQERERGEVHDLSEVMSQPAQERLREDERALEELVHSVIADGEWRDYYDLLLSRLREARADINNRTYERDHHMKENAKLRAELEQANQRITALTLNYDSCKDWRDKAEAALAAAQSEIAEWRIDRDGWRDEAKNALPTPPDTEEGNG